MLYQQQMGSVQSDHELKDSWAIVSVGNDSECLQQDKIIEWVNHVIVKKQLTDQFAHVDVRAQLHKFVSHVHQPKTESNNNLMFNFSDAVKFYEWITTQQKHQVQQPKSDNNQIQNNGNERPQEHQNQKEKDHTDQKNYSKQQKKQKQQTNVPKNKLSQLGLEKIALKTQQNKVRQEQNQFQQAYTKQQQQQGQQSRKNHREYLRIIFDHYWRINYGTGNDPTFEKIQQQSHVMNINKFMIFCKDFGITKLNFLNKPLLVQVFKKNSVLCKQMQYQQFVSVLVKLSHLVFNPDTSQTPSQNSKYFQQFLLFLQINNFNTFKKKASDLNIKIKLNRSQSTTKKPTLSNYKFKYNFNNRNNTQVQERSRQNLRLIQSQQKLKPFKPIHKRNQTNSKYLKSKFQNQINKDHIQKRPIQAPKNLLNMPISPAPLKRISLKNKLSILTPDPTAGVIGYANIHKLKLLGKNNKINKFQSKKSLNSIVRQARNMIQKNLNFDDNESQFQSSNRISNNSRQTPSRVLGYSRIHNLQQNFQFSKELSEQKSQTERYINQFDLISISKRSYAPHGHSLLQKRKKPRTGNEQLQKIIGNNSDQDQFLQQHLNRQQKMRQINLRIQNRIKQIQMKQLY